jgi:hypothetical protein
LDAEEGVMTEHRHTYRDADGIRKTLIWDDSHRDRVTVQTEQDVEPILDGIARDRELMPHGVNKLAARLPVFIYENLVERGIAQDEDRFKAWLNGPEAAPWRIWPGAL